MHTVTTGSSIILLLSTGGTCAPEKPEVTEPFMDRIDLLQEIANG